MESRIIKNQERLALQINGENILPIAYMTYHPHAQQYEEFRSIGTRLFSVAIYIGDQGINSVSGIRPFRPSLWKGENTYDFSAVDEDLARIAPAGEKVYILPRVYLDCPMWWEQSHPEELCRDQSGIPLRQSFVSERWREDTAKVIRALIDHVQASPWAENVAGWQLAAGGTEEWTYHRRRDFPVQFTDYSVPGQKAWQDWLQQKYGTVSELNHAWRKQYEDFAVIPIPSPAQRSYAGNGVLRDPVSEAAVIDFYQFHNDAIADTILYFCRVVKEHTNRRCITGAFYGYLFELPYNDFGHHSLGKVLDSPDLDFLASPNSYMELRKPGIDWPEMSAVDSARLHGKLWIIESDTRTHLTRAMKDTMPYADPGNGYYRWEGVWKGPEKKNALSLMEKGFGKILTGQMGTWWFDMWGGWYRDPDYMDFLKRAGDLMLQQEQNPAKAVEEIAVFADDRCYSYFARDASELMQLIYLQRKELGNMGAPCHFYLAEDLLREDFDADRYKMVIFLNCVKMENKVARAVNEKLKCHGKTLVWIFLEDCYDERNQPKNEPVTDFSVTYDPDADADQAEYKGRLFPESPVVCPRVETEQGDRILARFTADGQPAVVLRPKKDYTAVYSAAPNLPASLMMELASLNGIHLYSLTEDVLYADSRYLCMHAAKEGWKRIYFRTPAAVCDAWTGEQLSDKVWYYDFYMKEYETRTFFLCQ